MTITKSQRQEMLEAAKPLMQWLADNCHPHCEAAVDQTSVALVEGVATARTDLPAEAPDKLRESLRWAMARIEARCPHSATEGDAELYRIAEAKHLAR